MSSPLMLWGENMQIFNEAGDAVEIPDYIYVVTQRSGLPIEAYFNESIASQVADKVIASATGQIVGRDAVVEKVRLFDGRRG